MCKKCSYWAYFLPFISIYYLFRQIFNFPHLSLSEALQIYIYHANDRYKFVKVLKMALNAPFEGYLVPVYRD